MMRSRLVLIYLSLGSKIGRDYVILCDIDIQITKGTFNHLTTIIIKLFIIPRENEGI